MTLDQEEQPPGTVHQSFSVTLHFWFAVAPPSSGELAEVGEEDEEQRWERERKERQEQRQREQEEAREREQQELQRLERETVGFLFALMAVKKNNPR